MKYRFVYALLALSFVVLGCDTKSADIEPFFEFSPTSAEIPAAGGIFQIDIVTNVEYTCEVHDAWISEIAPISENSHRFKVAPNDSTEGRSCTVSLCANNSCMIFKVEQMGKEGADGINWSGSFKHRSLALRFTADWCGYCPNMASAFEQAKTALSGDLEIISMHGSGSSMYYSSLSAYSSRFLVSGYPTGIVDARASVINYSPVTYPANATVNVAQETVSAHPTKTGIAISSSVEGRTVTADVSIYAKEVDNYKVYAMLLEDDIIGYQNGGGSDYEHDHIARVQLSSVSGDPMNITSANTVWTKTYTAEVPSSYNLSNMRVIVYVEKPYGNQTKSTNVYYVEYENYGDTYVDNSRSVKVGQTGAIEIL